MPRTTGVRPSGRPRRRRRAAEAARVHLAHTPWALGDLLRHGAAPLAASADGEEVAIVLPPGAETAADTGLPQELLDALARAARVHVVADRDLTGTAPASIVLAAGWSAAPAVLRLAGAHARAVLATPDPPPLAHLGWADGLPVLAPRWLGGTLPTAADAAYAPLPVHRREDLVLVHGDDVLGLLAAAELLDRRPELSIAVSGTATTLELPFPSIAIEPGTEALVHAFASASVALAPPVRGWRPAAVAMLACGQPVVASAGAASPALGDAITFVDSPAQAADAAVRLIEDWELRSQRVRTGFALVEGGWEHVAEDLLGQLRRLR